MAAGIEIKELLQSFTNKEEGMAWIHQQVQDGVLAPVKSSKESLLYRGCYNRYRTVKDKEDYSREIDELNYVLMPPLSPAYYKRHLKAYRQDRTEILMLNSFLMDHIEEEAFKEPASINERSFQIWNQEKFLQSRGKKMLEHLQYDIERLNCYETVEPICSYSLSLEPDQNVLILENLDPFVTLRRLMMEARPAASISVFGRDIHTIIYGGGKRIWSLMNDWLKFGDPALLSGATSYFYFGDLDYVGIDIYEKLVQKFPQLPIQLFTPGYEQLMERAALCRQLPQTKDGQQEQEAPVFWSHFSAEDQQSMKALLETRAYLPQEMLSRIDYLQPAVQEASGRHMEPWIQEPTGQPALADGPQEGVDDES